ncbi:hypothetical protein SERLA73DRAFT_162812 [Serpula lacrymans var. lacrymans S7.3]|uniref:Uncharacterized protein n=2 Tax=Serpula lacrymans var. lacrymans TaxID=341189 RepID=F8QAA6_SERL3|nr:uncharacterized protein SERLADRAFT_417954 [Serpula lacrymans var. lacrymans S7.9]EGN94696.1 hypothetical protein SERLA73DRAFT_162812 [Serpula lacrymans var. lacrymans S7.3]EGO20174.1 hypothetical protein SERLADRAFT_417954 [Serpula lacrymans var. lacrymans S7.9]
MHDSNPSPASNDDKLSANFFNVLTTACILEEQVKDLEARCDDAEARCAFKKRKINALENQLHDLVFSSAFLGADDDDDPDVFSSGHRGDSSPRLHGLFDVHGPGRVNLYGVQSSLDFSSPSIYSDSDAGSPRAAKMSTIRLAMDQGTKTISILERKSVESASTSMASADRAPFSATHQFRVRSFPLRARDQDSPREQVVLRNNKPSKHLSEAAKNYKPHSQVLVVRKPSNRKRAPEKPTLKQALVTTSFAAFPASRAATHVSSTETRLRRGGSWRRKVLGRTDRLGTKATLPKRFLANIAHAGSRYSFSLSKQQNGDENRRVD